MGLNLDKIKNEEDLKKVLKFLEDQGFGYQSAYWELHNKKIDNIVSKANTLNIKYDSSLKERLYKLKDYDEVSEEAKNFFTKFTPDDKINEFINEFYLSTDETVRTPYSRPDAKDIIAWTDFRNKFNLQNDFGVDNHIEYYNLDKNYLKINFGSYKEWEFKRLYKLIFNEECVEFEAKKVGLWVDLGKIEIKFFLNGKASIKGDLKKIKEYYYKYLKNRNGNTIITYNKKIDITKHKD